MSLFFHELAELEIRESFTWYEQRSPALALSFITEFQAALDQIEANPMVWALYGDQVSRSVRLKRFRYRIVYRIDGADIRIIAVTHYKRKFGHWQGRVS